MIQVDSYEGGPPTENKSQDIVAADRTTAFPTTHSTSFLSLCIWPSDKNVANTIHSLPPLRKEKKKKGKIMIDLFFLLGGADSEAEGAGC